MDAIRITPIQDYPERAVPRPENDMCAGGHENRDGEVLFGRLEIPFTEHEVHTRRRLGNVPNPALWVTFSIIVWDIFGGFMERMAFYISP